MSILTKVGDFILLLGGLVFVHEFGHFLAAKLSGVKVLRFSLGFGPRIVGFRRGETEYQLAALPLGGYVRMTGEDPTAPVAPEDRGRGFAEQRPLTRAFIAFAGPFVNLSLPVLVFFVLNLVPQPQLPPIVAVVLPHEPADRAGIEPRDRVVSVDGIPTRSFDEMKEAIESRGGRSIAIVVDRNGEQKTLHLVPTSETEQTQLETTHKGRIGIITGKLPSYVGVVPGSRAWNAGLRTFDRVISVDGRKVSTSVDLDDALRKAGEHAALTLEVVRGTGIDLKTTSISTEKVLSVSVPVGPAPLGFDTADLYVREVEEGSQAWVQGLRPLDRIVAFNGTPVYSGLRVKSLMDNTDDIHLQVDRAGQRFEVALHPVEVVRRDPLLGPVPRKDFGFEFDPALYVPEPLPPSEMVMVSYPPLRAAKRAVTESVDLTRGMLLGVAAIFEHKISTENIGGPIQLYQLASAYGDQGWIAFFNLFALISINLGLINLIPVPVLDGFHIVLAGVEGVSRRAVPMRAREVANWVGVAMLVALMALAFKNDIVRVLGL